MKISMHTEQFSAALSVTLIVYIGYDLRALFSCDLHKGVLWEYCEKLANQHVNQLQDIIIKVQSSDWWNCGLGLGSQ